jgi:hypothetical protein
LSLNQFQQKRENHMKLFPLLVLSKDSSEKSFQDYKMQSLTISIEIKKGINKSV